MWQSELWAWKIVLITSALAIGCIFAIVRFRAKVMTSFGRALMHLEAVRLEDYKQYAKAVFPGGVVGKFHQHLRDFSDDLSEKKQRYSGKLAKDLLLMPVLLINFWSSLTLSQPSESVR